MDYLLLCSRVINKKLTELFKVKFQNNFSNIVNFVFLQYIKNTFIIKLIELNSIVKLLYDYFLTKSSDNGQCIKATKIFIFLTLVAVIGVGLYLSIIISFSNTLKM
jgi:hypothetical protein